MEVSRRHAVGQHRWVTASVILAGVTVVSTVAIGVLAVVVARMVVTPPRSRNEDVEVVGVDRSAATVTFTRSPDSVIAGQYSFWFAGATGHARIGTIVEETRGSVTRELLGVDCGELAPSARGRFNGWMYLSPHDLGVRYENVLIDTELGPAPAWLIPRDGIRQSGKSAGATDRWVIQVHGRAVIRAETLRAIPVFQSAGYTSLLISYRNDGQAPPSADGLYGLGATEWRDVEAAISFARDHGATSIVLMGWSMGGALALQTVTRSQHASVIHGLVLESPVIDWVSALDHQGKTMGMVRPIRSAAYAMLSGAWARIFTGLRSPIDLSRMNFIQRAGELRVPILILHSDDDDYVPSAASHALAGSRPDIVTLEIFSTARHTKLWNYDRQRWERTIASWLKNLR